MAKYIFITGGVVSSLGKGVAAASCGALLQSRGYSVHARKFDPYLNIDPGTMSPFQHGEVYVTNDGFETDLDLGYYERFLGIKLNRHDSVSGGRIYWDVLNAERRGDYLGATVQMIPHVSNKLKEYISAPTNTDFVVCEIGGTVGDIEGKIFLESARQFANDVGRRNVMFVHLTLAPYLEKSGELKTKPTQMSVRHLLENGIQADMLIVRTPRMLEADERAKIAMFCNISPQNVISGIDVDNIYKIPLAYDAQHVFDIIADHFGLPSATGNMDKFKKIEHYLDADLPTVTIGMVGKYFHVPDAYKSLNEALFHAGIQNNVHVKIKKINAEEFSPDACADVDGILVPGGFGVRGVDGKIAAAGYARENKVPYMGICLGMQVAVIDFARNVLGISDADSTEFNKNCTPVIGIMADHELVALVNNGEITFNKSRASNHYFTFDTWKRFARVSTDTPNTRAKHTKGLYIFRSPKIAVAYMQKFTTIQNDLEKLCNDNDIRFIVSYIDINAPYCEHKILRGGFILYESGKIIRLGNPRRWNNLH